MELYDQLERDSQNIEVTNEKWTEVSATINKLPLEHLCLVFALILHHYITKDSGKLIEIERLAEAGKLINLYGSKLVAGKKGPMFIIDRLPTNLQKIIIQYVSIAGTA